MLADPGRKYRHQAIQLRKMVVAVNNDRCMGQPKLKKLQRLFLKNKASTIGPEQQMMRENQLKQYGFIVRTWHSYTHRFVFISQ